MLNLKPFQETLHGGFCGPASLKIVLDYYGINKTEQELADLTKKDNTLGTNATNIKDAAESLGLKVEIKDFCEYENIQYWLDKEVPVIVNWFTRGRNDYLDSEVADGHYSVVIDLDNKFICLQDPEIGNIRKIDRDDFYRVWFDFKSDHITSWEDLIIRQIIAIYK